MTNLGNHQLGIRRRQALPALILALLSMALIANPAHAKKSQPCKNMTTLTGAGSQFQKGAHDRWRSVLRSKCNSNDPRVHFIWPADSVYAMSKFGLGAQWNPLHKRSDLVRFIGVDEAPTQAQKAEMEQGEITPGGSDKTNADDGLLRTIPVATGAIVFIVDYPHNCTIPAAVSTDANPRYNRFTRPNAELEKAWAGDEAVDTWGELIPGIAGRAGRSDSSCAAQKVRRVVRKDESSMTKQFKHWLDTINPARGWNASPQQFWPSNDADSPVIVPSKSGAKFQALAAQGTDGAIGYVDLATARANTFRKTKKHDESFWIPLQNGTGTYVEPPTKDPESMRTNYHGANCGSTVQKTRWQNVPTGSDPTLGDWSQVVGIAPPTGYPLCILTYVLAWDDYADVYNFGSPSDKARERMRFNTLFKYLGVITSPAGQSSIQTYDYFKLPQSKQQDLAKVARDAAAAIGWNK